MTAKELVDLGHKDRLFSDKLAGQTPHQTMKSKLSVHIRRHGEASPFVRTAPGRFYLRELLTDPPYEALRYTPSNTREQILAFPSEWLDEFGRFQGIRISWKKFLKELATSDASKTFGRLEAELQDDYKQLLTYIMVRSGESVLSFKRGTFSRVEDYLRGSHCIGFGGHLAEQDLNLFSYTDLGLRQSAARELSEELTIPESDRKRLEKLEGLEIVGLLNDDSSPTGRRHFAFVMQYEVGAVDQWTVPKRGEKSITQLSWLDLVTPDIPLRDFEYWSQLCLRQFFAESVRAQPSYRIRREKPLRQQHILCVIGEVGSGKSEATSILCRDFGYTEINSGRVLAQLMNVSPIPRKSRETFQEEALRFIAKPGGPRRLAEELYKRVTALKSDKVLIDGIRHRRTLEELRRISQKQIATLFIYTPPDIAYTFYVQREKATASIHDFLSVRESEVEREVSSLITDSDAIVYNWTGKSELRKAVRELMHETKP